MHSGSVQALQLVFLLLLLFVVAFGALARRLQTPYPIVLVIAGASAFWLFHPVFIRNVILPMLHSIGAT